MKDTKKIVIILLPFIAVAGIVFLFSMNKRKRTNHRRREQIANEGYETAGDILFPQKKQIAKYKTKCS